MGLFNKLKNALLEVEEIEIPIKEPLENNTKQVIKDDSVDKKTEIEKKKKETLLEENERDLFKAENTFKFPEFDEDEFKTSYKPPIEMEEKKERTLTPKESLDRVKPITFEMDKKPKLSRKETLRKEIEEPKNIKKVFTPSPVISPVYGVLDKNYKKEDIITVKEEPKKKIDVDTIRKKAFGTLEEDIEKTFDTSKEDFYVGDTSTIEDLLNESADDKIDLLIEKRRVSRESRNEKTIRSRVDESGLDSDTAKRSDRHPLEEQELESTEDLQVLDEQPNKSEEQKFEEDTLENDLFDLIDSMYDNREEEE